MQIASRILVTLASLVLGAHLLRGGHSVAAAALALLPVLLFVRHRIATWTIRLALGLGALEWLRTLVSLVDIRREQGLPFTRLAIILGGVALVTATAALLAGTRAGRRAEPA